MKKKGVFLIVLIAILVIGSCQKEIFSNRNFAETKAVKKFSETNEFVQYDAKNVLLEEMSIVLARKLESSVKLRKFIKRHAEKKLDGDYDILFSSITDSIIGSSKVSEIISNNISEDVKGLILGDFTESLIELIPYLQISIPVNIDSWITDEFSPKVAYNPIGVSLSKISHVRSFNSNGVLEKLSLLEEPSEPVIVIGISERYQNVEKYSKKNVIGDELEDPEDPGSGGSTPDPIPYCDRDVNIGEFDFVTYASFVGKSRKQAYEPWTAGDAEVRIYMSYLYVDHPFNDTIIKKTYRYGYCDDWTKWGTGDIKLATINDNTLDFDLDKYGDKMIISFVEEDGDGGIQLKTLVKIAVKIFNPFKSVDENIDFEAELDLDSDDILIGSYIINYHDKEFYNDKGKKYTAAFDYKFRSDDLYFYVKQK